MREFLIVLLTAAIVTYLATPLVRRVAQDVLGELSEPHAAEAGPTI